MGLLATFVYYLLYSNSNYRLMILSRTDVELLVMPLLRYLHFARYTEQETPLLIVVGIVLILLTRDAPVNMMAGQTNLATVPWYQGLYLLDVTLLDLIFLVATKVLLKNLVTTKNEFIQELYTGILGNVAKYFHRVHPTVAHQLVPTLSLLLKKAAKQPLVSALLDALLYTFNILLFFSLPSSPALVYSLLHQREELEQYSHPLLANIHACIRHFAALLDKEPLENAAGDLSDAVLRVIQKGLRSWKYSILSAEAISPVRFGYTEEDDSSEFFHPYIWSLVSTFIPFGSLLAATDSSSLSR